MVYIYWSSKGELGTGTRGDVGLDGAGRKWRIAVGEGGEGANVSVVVGPTKIVAFGDSVTTVGGVQGPRSIDENIVLDQKLSPVAGIDPKMDIAEVVVVNAVITCECVIPGLIDSR